MCQTRLLQCTPCANTSSSGAQIEMSLVLEAKRRGRRPLLVIRPMWLPACFEPFVGPRGAASPVGDLRCAE